MINSAIASFFITLLALGIFDYGSYKDGYSYGFWNMGNMIFMGVVIISNLKMLYISNSYSVTYILSIFISILLFFLSWYIANGLESDNLY